MEKQVQTLLQYSQALGVLKFVSNQHITNFKLTFHPFVSSKNYYDYLGELETLWQRLLFKVSKDIQFLKGLYEPLTEQDEMIRRLLALMNLRGQQNTKDGITFVRCDYYNNLQGQPKLTQYNLYSVGMQSHMEQFQQAKKLTDDKQSHLYAECSTIRSFASIVKDAYIRKQMNGLMLLVTLNLETNQLDQMRLVIELNKKGIKVKRVTFVQLASNIHKHQNGNLYYGDQLVSVVYYRTGYKLEHYAINGDVERGWSIKEKIELSNAICIPPVVMELVNEKRTQAELTKPEVLRRFVTEEEALMLEKTFVKQWEFTSMSEEQYQEVLKMVAMNPEHYILKPNLEGGGNNFYGKVVLQMLQKMTREESEIYILMEKIDSRSFPNTFFLGQQCQQVNCLYEISRYGAFSWLDGELFRNEAYGFLIRAKPQSATEGGIMTGVGSIVPWKFGNE